MSIKRALISVYDKTGIVDFAKELNKLGIEIITTEGTFKILKKCGIQFIKKVSDVTEFQEHLAAQSYGGGGDFPEAPDLALEYASQLAWRTSPNAAKLLFWVADAPHHTENAQALADSIAALQQIDVHIYPVASSGIDELTEFAMRGAAQLTLGRYLFLTDDSGFGSGHKEPTTPCYYVTGLDDAILRMVELEMTGERSLPADSDVVRTVGDPQSGTCELPSGSTAQAI